MAETETVFLFDVDNTLLDNDRVTQDLKNFLDKSSGLERSASYWRIFEELRRNLVTPIIWEPCRDTACDILTNRTC